MSASAGQGDRPKGRNKGLLKEKLELEKVKTKDGRTRVTLKPIDDELTFDKGFYVFIRVLQLLRSHNEGVIIVGLGGASGSGKTAFSHKVKDFMPGIAIISMDMYNDASKLVDENFDDPRLTDYDLLLQNLADLKAGKPADVSKQTMSGFVCSLSLASSHWRHIMCCAWQCCALSCSTDSRKLVCCRQCTGPTPISHVKSTSRFQESSLCSHEALT
eukprot:GHUV01013025.1.p1 GENE.GHUV01013025.1~~GHUV01013025.1.p1  ORF type:complete len:216 (+),score=29.41 GHUV01013025.1:259-906(+)